MNQRQLAAVLFAVTGVYLTASALSGVFSYFAILIQLDPAIEDPSPIPQRTMAFIAIGSSIVVTVFAGVLIFGRNRLAAWFFPASAASLADTQIQAVAFSILGCYLAALGISGFLPEALVPGGWFNWGQGVQALFGIALFFGASGLSSIWTHFRERGRSK